MHDSPGARHSSDPPPSYALAGRYTLMKVLGRGGGGTVWLAHDRVAGVSVAVKLLTAMSTEERLRVRREASALRRLRVPGVVRLLDEGTDGDRPFLVLELVEGTAFPGVPTPCAWEAVEPAAVALLETLDRVHAAGVLHRDLKPQNVFVERDGRVHLFDFGVARVGLGERVTATGEMLGTPHYLPPEVVRGEVPTPASDLYSFGVMLFEALAGRLPFEGENYYQLLHARVSERPAALATLRPDLPRHACELVDALLSADLSRRPASATEVIALIQRSSQPTSDTQRLPWVGDLAVVEILCEAARSGRSVDLAGGAGSGRSTTLRRVAAVLKSEGRRCVWALPSRAPFGSLAMLAEAGVGDAGDSLDVVTERTFERAAAALEAGTALFVDDVRAVDRWSERVIQRCRRLGTVLRAVDDESPATGEGAMRLAAWTEAELAMLFAGPERLLHIPSTAAQRLHARTGGVPSRVVAELDAWTRAGLVRRDGPLFATDPEALDRLGADERPRPLRARSAPSLEPDEQSLLAWVNFAWPDASIALVAELSGAERWKVEAALEALESRSLLRRRPDGTLESTVEAPGVASEADRRRGHRAIAAALPESSPRRWGHLVAGMDDDDEPAAVARQCVFHARRAAESRSLGEAMATLDEGVRALDALRADATAEADAALTLWAELALASEDARALDRVLYELCRSPRSPAVTTAEGLVRAGLARGRDPARALALTDQVGVVPHTGLELRRQSLRVAVARGVRRELAAAVTAEALRWAGSSPEPGVHAQAAAWRARLCYRAGRFDEAAALQAEAAAWEPWAGPRVVALARASSAMMEAFRHDEAAALAREAQRLAARCRMRHAEATAEWVLRGVAYRQGLTRGVDVELVSAAEALGDRHVEALICFTEAAVAWRLGEATTATALAGRSHDIWRGVELQSNRVLARALMAASGEAPTDDDLAAALDELSGCTIAGLGVQALGLLAMAAPRVRELVPASLVSAQAGQVEERHWGERIDVLSVDESLRALGLGRAELARAQPDEVDPRPSLVPGGRR